jgi:predicted AlkP superfamily phosphohydrolase/phosphomutase
VRASLRDRDVLVALSDHGFTDFDRCVNLNAWLRAHGFLSLRREAPGTRRGFADVDWARTQAYAVGMNGIYLNVAGREAEGTVGPGGASKTVRNAIAVGLTDLVDPETGRHPVRRVFDSEDTYWGPYRCGAPDLVVGFASGYRVAWDSATGGFDGPVLTANGRAWHGDHCVDPALVPGVLACTRPLEADRPGIVDLAPTALAQFGIAVPSYMDGKPLLPG